MAVGYESSGAHQWRCGGCGRLDVPSDAVATRHGTAKRPRPPGGWQSAGTTSCSRLVHESHRQLIVRDRRVFSHSMPRSSQAPFIDLPAIIPEIRAFARRAVRLHPVPAKKGSLAACEVGGYFSVSKKQPWPTCSEHHCPMVGIMELRAPRKMLPVLKRYGDLLQVFWCPEDHDPIYGPMPYLRWFAGRSTTRNTNAQWKQVHSGYGLVPRPCRLHPELITEYPDPHDLPKSIIRRIEGNAQITAIGERFFPDHDDYGASAAYMAYKLALSCAPGTKLGGWGYWIQRSIRPTCRCGARMVLLLTVASREWNIQTQFRWKPTTASNDDQLGVMLGDCGRLYILACPSCAELTITADMQSS